MAYKVMVLVTFTLAIKVIKVHLGVIKKDSQVSFQIVKSKGSKSGKKATLILEVLIVDSRTSFGPKSII